MVSDQTTITDATEAQLAASASSMGDFSRFGSSSLSMSRVTGLDGSTSMIRGNNPGVRDPLSMVSLYSSKRATKTPDPCIHVAIMEEDEDEPDF